MSPADPEKDYTVENHLMTSENPTHKSKWIFILSMMKVTTSLTYILFS